MTKITYSLRLLILCVAMTAAYVPATVAQLTYSFDVSSGVLTIGGSGTEVTSQGVRGAIGGNAVENTTLKQIDFSGATGITSIGEQAFYRCAGITGTLTLPAGLTNIGYSAFEGCRGITGALTLPAGLTSIGNSAFEGCIKITSIRSLAQVPPTLGVNVVLDTRIHWVFVPEGKVQAYKTAWSAYASRFTFVEKEEVVTINVATPGTLGASILQQSGKHPSVVNKLTITGTINDTDFGYMRSNMPLLYTIDMSGAGNTTIPDNAFTNAKLLEFDFPAGLTYIGHEAFSYCYNISSLTFPAGLTSIDERAFEGCSGISSLTFPAGLTSIGNNAFDRCSGITSLTLLAGLTSIGDYAFFSCSGIASLTLPAGLTSIGFRAFSSCSGIIGALTLPAGLTSIGEQAFYRCIGITGALTLPAGLTSIGNSAFEGCASVNSIRSANPVPPALGNRVFSGIDAQTCTLIIPKGAAVLNAYFSAPQWGSFINIVQEDFEYTATFDSQGGSAVSPAAVSSGALLPKPTDPTRTGYTFEGWYKEAACTTAWVFATDKVTANVMLYAKWAVASIPIVGERSQTKAVVTWPLNAAASAYLLNLYKADKTTLISSYEFDHQGRLRAVATEATFNIEGLTGTLTYYVMVEARNEAGGVVATQNAVIPTFSPAVSRTVTFNSQGGSTVVSDVVESGKHVIAPTAPSRTGYTFMGWHKEAACTTAWDFATSVVTANVILYAKWEVKVGIEQPDTDQVRIYGTVGRIIVEGVTVGEQFSIITMEGTVVHTATITDSHTTVSLPAGIYVVKTTRRTTKAVVR